MSEDVVEGLTNQRVTSMGSEILKTPEGPVYPLVEEYSDMVSKHPPSQLPQDRGVRHEIDLWPLPREQCEVIDAFFAEKAKSGMVRESKSPHSTPTFCVRKPNGKWRLVHAYNKLNNATVPTKTPTPRKDVLLNNIALDLVDGYYQILMRESDIPLTAVNTPSVMLLEWLVMPQGLSNAPATFNRLVAQLFRPLPNKLYTNIDKCVFAAEEINGLGCFVSRVGVRPDPGKVKVIAVWPTPRSQKDLRKWLGLANYLHKDSAVYAELARPLSNLLKKDTDWVWEHQHQDAFDSIKARLRHAPVLALPDENKSFSV
ncbi:Pol protein, partial [Phytophthora palmivora]